eukprot:3004886-Prymnesium_polylepis.2
MAAPAQVHEEDCLPCLPSLQRTAKLLLLVALGRISRRHVAERAAPAGREGLRRRHSGHGRPLLNARARAFNKARSGHLIAHRYLVSSRRPVRGRDPARPGARRRSRTRESRVGRAVPECVAPRGRLNSTAESCGVYVEQRRESTRALRYRTTYRCSAPPPACGKA